MRRFPIYAEDPKIEGPWIIGDKFTATLNVKSEDLCLIDFNG
jgi:hypothetical protein